MPSLPDISFIGFGEAATALTKGWHGANLNVNIKAFDVKTNDAVSKDGKIGDYKTHNVQACLDAKAGITGASVIISLVTADQAALAAASAAKHIEQGQYYFDCNSCAPNTKKANAKLINAAGGRYVDVAVMAPVYPQMHRVPMLICGKYAQDTLPIFERLGMNATYVEGEVGHTSSIKMVRSIMMKGLEALVAECMLSARKLGIDETVMASLDKTYPGFDWHTRSGYMLERMSEHGIRRAAEMREVAITVDQLGLHNGMAKATVDWHQTIGDMKLGAETEDFDILADLILEKLEGNE